MSPSSLEEIDVMLLVRGQLLEQVLRDAVVHGLAVIGRFEIVRARVTPSRRGRLRGRA